MVKIVKVILEKEDIIKLIKGKYPTAEIEKGLADDIEVFIKVEEIETPSLKDSVQTIPPKIIPMVRDEMGNIDAVKSGLTLDNRKKTVPGGKMGRARNNLPKF